MLRDVLTGCKTFNQAAIKLPTGSIVDISDVCRLVKPGSLDQTLQAVTLAVIVFNVYQKAEAILGSSICVIKASDIEVSRISISLSIVL